MSTRRTSIPAGLLAAIRPLLRGALLLCVTGGLLLAAPVAAASAAGHDDCPPAAEQHRAGGDLPDCPDGTACEAQCELCCPAGFLAVAGSPADASFGAETSCLVRQARLAAHTHPLIRPPAALLV